VGAVIDDEHNAQVEVSTARVLLLTPDWSGVLDASVTSRYQLRLTREDVLEGATSVFDPSDDRLARAREEQRRTGSFHGRLRLRPSGGAPFEATVSIAAGVAAGGGGTGGEPQGLVTMTYDSDRQVPTELEQNWSRHPLHHSPDVVALYEADGTLRYISPSVEDVLGWTPQEMTGRVTIDLVHPDDVEPMIDAMLSAAGSAGPPSPMVFRVLHRDGGWRHLEVMLRDLSEDPDVGGSTVHFRDITQRVEEVSASYFEGLNALDGSAGGLAHVTSEGRPVRFNEAFLDVLGHSREDLVHLGSVSDAVHPADRDAHRAALLHVARDGQPAVAEWRHLRSDGSLVWVSSKVHRPSRSGAAPDLLVMTVEDVSARKEAEHALGLLTRREREVLGLICEGLDNSAIARSMYVSVHTVKHHVQNVLRKLEVSDRRRAAARVAALDVRDTRPPRPLEQP